MQRLIHALSPTAEFVTVIGVCFGYFIIASLWSAFLPVPDPVVVVPADTSLIGLVAIEGMLLPVAALFLWARGWRLSDFPLGRVWIGTLGGILLFATAYLLFLLVLPFLTLVAGSDQLDGPALFADRPSVAVALIASTVNPVFEEGLVVGYVVKALEGRQGAPFAVGASVLIRLLYHTYQGPIIAASILPLGLLFALAYWRWRALWPLILAHGLFDFIGLMQS